MRICKVKDCGGEVYSGKSRCYKCERQFIDRRKALYNAAVKKFGGLTSETLPKIQKYIKKREGGDDNGPT